MLRATQGSLQGVAPGGRVNTQATPGSCKRTEGVCWNHSAEWQNPEAYNSRQTMPGPREGAAVGRGTLLRE